MEELTAALATSFSVSKELNTTAAEHPRFSQYKLKLSPSERQEARRRKILEIQKKARQDRIGSDPACPHSVKAKRPANSTVSSTGRRFDFANHARSLTEGVFDQGDHQAAEQDAGGELEQEEEEEMEVQTSLRRPGRYYQDQLMYSEWLVEVPNDFEKEWMMVVCPVGKRRLVIAARGETTAYSKGGYKCMTFPSHLPGGRRGQGGRSQYGESVILDCVYCDWNKTYFVLDMMYWKNMPIYDSETEFRFYWMHEKLQETELVSVVRKSNPYRFIPLPSFPCTASAISNSLACATFDIDGLLFYHKRTHYTFGPTPLVVWLKTYMVPDVLNIAVPYKELAKAPPSYTNYSKHLDSVKDQTYGSAPEKARLHSGGGRGRGRGGRGRGRGGGRGRGDSRKENMDASDTVEENSSADNSLNISGLSSAGETTPQKERGIIQMPKAFNFGTSPTSPFNVSSPDSKSATSPDSEEPQPITPLPDVPIVSAAEAIADLNAKNSAQTVSEPTEEDMCAGGDQGNKEERKGKKNKSKKSRNRGRKGRNTKMDTSDAQ